MPPFRQRPLTWLFLIATACINLNALAAKHASTWFDAFAAGQTLVAGGWLVLGAGHRLGRAAIVVAAIGFGILPDYLHDDAYVAEWPYVLGTLLVMAAACAIVSLAWAVVAALAARRPLAAPYARWQFPLSEIFGWMIIAAVATSAGKHAVLPPLIDNRTFAAIDLGLAAAGIMCLAVVDWAGSVVWRVAVAASIAMSLALCRDIAPCIYVTVWCLVYRLEGAPLTDVGPRLRLHDEPAAAPSQQ